jgi:hypothetical protein
MESDLFDRQNGVQTLRADRSVTSVFLPEKESR